MASADPYERCNGGRQHQAHRAGFWSCYRSSRRPAVVANERKVRRETHLKCVERVEELDGTIVGGIDLRVEALGVGEDALGEVATGNRTAADEAGHAQVSGERGRDAVEALVRECDKKIAVGTGMVVMESGMRS